jgi:hypothetical protein
LKCNNGGATFYDFQYVIEATCANNYVFIGKKQFELTKETVAIWVVICDLVMCLVVFIALMLMIPFMKLVDDDINNATIMADDFTVAIKPPPYADKLCNLRAIYWSWAENVC